MREPLPAAQRDERRAPVLCRRRRVAVRFYPSLPGGLYAAPCRCLCPSSSHRRYSDVLILLDGATRLHAAANAILDKAAAGCVDPHGDGAWLDCPVALNLRLVRIYSPDRGTLTVTDAAAADGGATSYQVAWRGHTVYKDGDMAAKYVYTAPSVATCFGPNGYTFAVPAGAEIHISLPTALDAATDAAADVFVVEYSEPQLPLTQITLSVSGDPLLEKTATGSDGSDGSDGSSSSSGGNSCVLRSDHDRAYITPYGPLVPTAGAWWGCVGWPTSSNASDFDAAFDASWPVATSSGGGGSGGGSSVECSEGAQIYCFGQSVADALCVSSPVVGCNFAGLACCRLCDADGYNRCEFRAVPFTGVEYSTWSWDSTVKLAVLARPHLATTGSSGCI